MKALIIGNGQLGSYIFNHWDKFNNIDIDIADFPEFDITSRYQCEQYIKKYDIIINCAAYTNVDKAQEQIFKCLQTNSDGPAYLAEYCKLYKKKLIHISSEAVYGSNDLNYQPINQRAQKTPMNIYSLSKLNGDNAVEFIMKKDYIILRAGWLFGPNSDHNFIEKIKKLLESKSGIKVVGDQIGSLTSVSLVLNVIKKYILNLIPDGVYNVANNGYTSRFQNAVFVKQMINSHCTIYKCSSAEFKRAANVAKNSCLDCSKLKQYYQQEIPWWSNDVVKMLKGEM